MALYSNSIFFIATDKIVPNPYQPRKEFEDGPLRDLADSIRQYGVLQPLVLSRVEKQKDDGSGLETYYELIAGERRLRASRLAGIAQVPAIIREGDDDKLKLELAIIENLQREDLNAVDRARAFMRLIDEFSLTHAEVGKKMGKSREYVSNSLRILQMPQDILDALQAGKIMEGHTRPLMMLNNKPDEQQVLFKEIVYKKLSVREAERIARRIAVDKVRKKELLPDVEVRSIEDELEEKLGTRVHIQRKADGGKITIDFFSDSDLEEILVLLKSKDEARSETMLQRFEREQKIPDNLPSIDTFVASVQNTNTETTQDFMPVMKNKEIAMPITSNNVISENILNLESTSNITADMNTIPFGERVMLQSMEIENKILLEDIPKPDYSKADDTDLYTSFSV
jgi:ParB family chromosome partitioning protein